MTQNTNVNVLILDTIHDHCKKYENSKTIENFIKKTLQYESAIWSNRSIDKKDIISEYQRIIDQFIKE